MTNTGSIPAEAWMQKWTAREQEIRAVIGAPADWTAWRVDYTVGMLLEREMAAEAGIDMAPIKANRLMREHGLREAEEIARHLIFVDATFGGEDAADEGRRVAEYLAEWLAAARAQLPWWQSILGV